MIEHRTETDEQSAASDRMKDILNSIEAKHMGPQPKSNESHVEEEDPENAE